MWEAFIEALKILYQSQASWLRRPIAGEDWRITDSFIQLALELPGDIFSTGSADKEKSALDWHEWYVNPAEKISQAKKALAYTQLFQSLPEESPLPVQKIWVGGAAGSGKSTLMQRMAYEWSTGKKETALWLPKEVGGVIWIKLRAMKAYLDLEDVETQRLTSTQKENIQAHRLRYNEDGQLAFLPTLAAYLSSKRYGWSRTQEEASWQAFLEQSAGQILWLIDGYDEIASLPVTHPVQVIFHDFLLQQPWLMVTSRPYCCCPERDKNTFRFIELLGFSQKNVIAYVDKHFDEKQDHPGYTRLKTLLTEHLKIRGLAHIPVNLEILCSVMSGVALPDFSHLNTTQLYSQLFFCLLKRAYWAHTLSADFISEPALIDDQTFLAAPKVQCLLMGLGTLALEKLKNSQAQFEASEFKVALRSVMQGAYGENERACFQDVLCSGLVRGLAWFAHQHDFRGQGEFLHLTLQEYLAAWAFTEQWKKSPQALISFVQEYKYDVHFARFWPFVVGLLAQDKLSSHLDNLAALMDSPPLPLQGEHHTLLCIRCLEELLPDTIPSVWSSFVRQYLAAFVSNSESFLFSPLTSELRQSPAWGRALAPLLTNRLRHGTLEQKRTTLSQVAALGGVVVTESLLAELIWCLSSDADAEVRRAAHEALGALGAAAAAPEVLAALMRGLQDNNSEVRSSAWEVLSALGAAAATPEVLTALMRGLQDSDSYVRILACDALGRLDAAAAAPEVLVALMSGLQDNDAEVRSSACKALGALGAAAATPEVLAALMSGLQDNNSEVRRSACKALGALGVAAVTPDVLAALMGGLQDSDSYVR
ncbi:MAG: HEAT repeat domain-containing protein, partial [Rickettsiales bacterium]|nr:HEAT repeat domain-containing protein [Rickettsiales bacterium]